MNNNEAIKLLSDIRIKGGISSIATNGSSAKRLWNPGADEDFFPFIGIDEFGVDVHKLLMSKALRRLQECTQVVTAPYTTCIRTRMTHTNEVVAIATMIAEVLHLNVELTRAIALGHDIGHVPFGHLGEKYLSLKLKESGHEGGFRHNVFGVIIAHELERKCAGLNLTDLTLKGMLHHSRGDKDPIINDSDTPESSVVMLADKIAYVLGDFSDMVRIGMSEGALGPARLLIEQLGINHRAQTMRLICGVCAESFENSQIAFRNSEIAKVFYDLKQEMYKLYGMLNAVGVDEALEKVWQLIEKCTNIRPEIVLALMNDKDVLHILSNPVPDMLTLQRTSVWEAFEYLARKRDLDITLIPKLNW